MLFDLKGKRRRTVQITYVGLAVLIGVGLVGGGIGSGVSGGVFDIFGGGNGGSSSNAPIEKKIKRQERLLRVNPHNQAALAAIVRYRYQIAAAKSDQRTGRFSKDAKKDLAATSTAWQRYLASNPKNPDASLAAQMVTVYSPLALNRPSNAAQAAEIVASAKNDAQSYLQLTGCAALAGQTRKAELAGQTAIDRASKAQKSQAKQAVKAAKSPTTAAQYCGGQ